jgi:hypothetical protein
MAINGGFSHENWWFSIAMLVYQRVQETILTGAKTNSIEILYDYNIL